MTTILQPGKKKLAKKALRYASDRVLGVELCSNGEVVAGGKVYGNGEGFILPSFEDAIAWKLPHLQAVFFSLRSGKTFALHFNANASRWRNQTQALVPLKKRQALPRKPLFYWISETLTESAEKGYYLPVGSRYPLSPSLRFLPGGLVEYTPQGKKSCTVPIGKLPTDTGPIELWGLSGTHAIRGVGQDRFHLQRLGSRWKERFLYDVASDSFSRHAIGRPLAPSEEDDLGLTYLDTGQIVFSMVPVPFRLSPDGSPWSVDLPGGERVVYVEPQYITIYDPAKSIAQRFCRPDGKWVKFDTGMWQVETPWILDGAKGFSTAVCGGVLELFADGSIRFLNQHQFPPGTAVNVTGPGGLLLVRDAGDQWIDLFENGDLVGCGVYDANVFKDNDGNWSSGWGWGCEREPIAHDRTAGIYFAWIAMVVLAVFLFYPGEVLLLACGTCVAGYILYFMWHLIVTIWCLLAPGFLPLVRLASDVTRAAIPILRRFTKPKISP